MLLLIGATPMASIDAKAVARALQSRGDRLVETQVAADLSR
ncbi:hypothetical protein [Thermoflexus sp.]